MSQATVDIPTKMALEIQEIPAAIQRILDRSEPDIVNAARELKARAPHVITTVARGSSDHAATYLKYAIELTSGIPVASIGPSIASIYRTSLKLEHGATIAISQSGKSPDIVEMARSATVSGAFSVAFTNTPASPLAEVSSHAINIEAGPELSVAATKSFVSSIVSGLLLLGHWQEDDRLLDAIRSLPAKAEQATGCNWSQLDTRLRNEASLYVLGRGPSLAIANEVALKFKETCQIHAEAYSSAEVMHGPVSIVGSGFPVLGLAARDAAEHSVVAMCDSLAQQQADVFITSQMAEHSNKLPCVETGHELTDPLMLIVSFYAFVESLARKRGLNPDDPPKLKKVTRTL